MVQKAKALITAAFGTGQSVSQSVICLFHGPAPRSPLHRLAVTGCPASPPVRVRPGRRLLSVLTFLTCAYTLASHLVFKTCDTL